MALPIYNLSSSSTSRVRSVIYHSSHPIAASSPNSSGARFFRYEIKGVLSFVHSSTILGGNHHTILDSISSKQSPTHLKPAIKLWYKFSAPSSLFPASLPFYRTAAMSLFCGSPFPSPCRHSYSGVFGQLSTKDAPTDLEV